MKFDATGKLIGFQDKTIHIMNKGAVALKGTANYDKVRGRKNVILLGDSPGCFAARGIIAYRIFPHSESATRGHREPGRSEETKETGAWYCSVHMEDSARYYMPQKRALPATVAIPVSFVSVRQQRKHLKPERNR